MVLLASDAALDNQTEVRDVGVAMGLKLAGPVDPLSLALPPGSSSEVLGPQWQGHRRSSGGHWRFPSLLDEPQADPDHPALRVPVSLPANHLLGMRHGGSRGWGLGVVQATASEVY